jgi:hypothetical protein
VKNSAPNPFQPMIDAAVSGFSKVAAALVLGVMVHVVIMLIFRRAGFSKSLGDFIGRAAMGFSALWFMYLGFVVMEPTKAGVPAVVFGPFMALALVIAAVLGGLILLLVFLGAEKTPERVVDQRKKSASSTVKPSSNVKRPARPQAKL